MSDDGWPSAAVHTSSPDWLGETLGLLARHGIVRVKGAVPQDLSSNSAAIVAARERTGSVVGAERYAAAVQRGDTELRMPFALDAVFFRYLEVPALLAVLDATLGESAILRFQNGITSRLPAPGEVVPACYSWHQNFKFPLPGLENRRVLVEVGFATGDEPLRIDIVPGSHLRGPVPAAVALAGETVMTTVWEPGDMIVVDPFLWHREVPPSEGRVAYGVHHQFSRPFIKPHADYCRAIAPDVLDALPPRTRRLLGTHARMPVSLADFYLPEEQRPYRPGQW